MSDDEFSSNYSDKKKGMRTVGKVLIIVGVVSTIFGIFGLINSIGSLVTFPFLFDGDFTEFFDNFVFNPINMMVNFGLLSAGIMIFFIGFALYQMTKIGDIANYYMKEMAPATEKSAEAFGRGFRRGTRGSRIQSKGQVIKIRCRECDTLNDENLKYCTLCGSKL